MQAGGMWPERERRGHLHPGEGATKAEVPERMMSCWERGGTGARGRTPWSVGSGWHPGHSGGEAWEAGRER